MTILPKKLNQMVEDNFPERKKQTVIKGLIFFIFIGLLLVLRPAFAGVGTFFGYKDDLVETYVMILSGESVRRTLGLCFGAGSVETIGSWTIVTNTLTVTASIGAALVFLHVLLAMIDEGRRGALTQEGLYRMLLTFVIPMALIANITAITNAIQGTGILMKDTIIRKAYNITVEEYEGSDTETLEDKAIQKEINNSGVAQHIRDIFDPESAMINNMTTEDEESMVNTAYNTALNFLLVCIIAFVDIGVRIGILVSCFSVLARLVIYQAMLPVSIADIGKDGARSNGARTIKRFLATYLEIAMFYIINIVGWKIADLVILKQDKVAWLVICFIGAGIGIRALMRSSRMVSERILGVYG